MKWLRENWTKVLLVIMLIGFGWVWRNGSENKKDYNTRIENYETNITLAQDTIGDLKNELEIEDKISEKLNHENDSLAQVIKDKEKTISDEEAANRKKQEEIDKLTPTEQVSLLSDNLETEMNKEVDLKINLDSTTTLDTSQVKTTNKVFLDRDHERKNNITLNELMNEQRKQIATKDNTIAPKERSIVLLTEVTQQQDDIIEDKESIIQEMDKQDTKNNWKFLGIGSGIGAGFILLLVLL